MDNWGRPSSEPKPLVFGPAIPANQFMAMMAAQMEHVCDEHRASRKSTVESHSNKLSSPAVTAPNQRPARPAFRLHEFQGQFPKEIISWVQEGRAQRGYQSFGNDSVSPRKVFAAVILASDAALESRGFDASTTMLAAYCRTTACAISRWLREWAARGWLVRKSSYIVGKYAKTVFLQGVAKEAAVAARKDEDAQMALIFAHDQAVVKRAVKQPAKTKINPALCTLSRKAQRRGVSLVTFSKWMLLRGRQLKTERDFRTELAFIWNLTLAWKPAWMRVA
jgi:hypothetical protein